MTTSRPSWILALLFLFALAGPAFSQQTNTGQGDAKKHKKDQIDEPVIVKPGETKTCRGMTIENTGTAGDVKMTPTGANSVTVVGDNGSQFTVTDMQAGDTVNLPTGSTSAVSGTGGTVNCPSNCTSTVQCNAGSSTNLINVNLPGGASAMVGGGSSVTFIT